MTPRRNPARLVIALSVAAVLTVFLLYFSLAGGATPSLRPSQLSDDGAKVSLAGMVVGEVEGSAREGGMEFTLQDINGTATIPVVYEGSVPELFRTGRHVFMSGELVNGVFVAEPDSLVTKCPSKYAPKDGEPT